MNKRTLALVAALPVTVLTLAACGSSSTIGSGSTSSTPRPGHSSSGAMMHNAADVSFAQAMIPPQQQAMQMAKLATTHAASSRVRSLAARIGAGQDPQWKNMTGWMKTWGQAMPTDMTGMAGMPGMMAVADMHALTAARGTAFDKRFLTMMIAHHNGTMTIAKAEVSDGSDPAAKALAQSIIDGQTTQIDEMKALLGSG